MISAIETTYAGHCFRSRLEARWAVFFDAMSIKWRYEAEGYQAEDGSRYLPDFYLPDLEVWCEVKGDPGGIQPELNRLKQVLIPGGPLPLLLLGDVPLSGDVVFHPLLVTSSKGLARVWSTFVPIKDGAFLAYQADIELQIDDPAHAIFSAVLGLGFTLDLDNQDPIRGLTVESRSLRANAVGRFYEVGAAYDKARSARFEYGRNG